MKRLLLLAAGVARTAAPAVLGLIDNPALRHTVPVRLPPRVVPVTGAQTDGSSKDSHGRSVNEEDSGKDRPGAANAHGRGGPCYRNGPVLAARASDAVVTSSARPVRVG